ncbi:hypothetical protein [Azospirillum sp. TSO35-2]|uniref:hypothetical protein n=1 Tax=Azospirillum sp. TSO35-2 TaxID=716796 RepID=UPI0011B3704C|nr:hypothetical protein [Azospirillum sp. TSO35-2]
MTKPNSTPIDQLGLSQDQINRLTPAAKQLTKGDLLALSAKKDMPALHNLTLKDIKSIETVMSEFQAQQMAAAGDVSCCTCTPCCSCCAAADTEPVRIV